MKNYYKSAVFALRPETNRYNRHALAGSLLLFVLLLSSIQSKAQQTVTGIVTDYNGFWKSSASSFNPVKPVSSHNLLSFTVNGTQYSTGVNDGALSSRGESFVAGDFWALPVENYTSPLTNYTKVALGEMKDEVHNGASTPAPNNGISRYITDGIKGLDIGTGVANLPVGSLSFTVSSLRPENIGDGIPDIIVTQIADPSAISDNYSFVDANGLVVGTIKPVNLLATTPLGTWTGDFYDAATSPMTLTSGFTNSDRRIRLWAADVSDLGITVNNYRNIRKFRISLSGDSDIAFVGYNNRTFSISTVLPVELGDLNVSQEVNSTKLNWSTQSENNSAKFVVEKNTGAGFKAIDSIKAAGYSSVTRYYNSTDKNISVGVSQYRLKMVDLDGKIVYSDIVTVTNKDAAAGTLKMFPNPATDHIVISQSFAAGDRILISNAAGNIVSSKAITSSTNNQTIQLNNFSKGIYHLSIDSKNGRTAQSFVVR